MEAGSDSLRIDPARLFGLDLSEAPGRSRRALLRIVLLASAGTVRVEGRANLERAPPGSIFVLSHHNSWEAVLAPAALVALRRGRPIRFLVDWMIAEQPLTSWLVRAIDPIPVYRKRARFGWREHRRREMRGFDPLAEAAATLARGGDVGLYPEGMRQRDPWRLGALRRGLARLALASGAPIVPVGVELPARDRLGRLPFLGRIVLRVGEPLRPPSIRGVALEARSSSASRTAELALLERAEVLLAKLSRKQPPRRRTQRKESNMALRFPGQPITVAIVESAADRTAALSVVDIVYRAEKRWIATSETEIAVEPTDEPRTRWLLARTGGEAVGVMRIVLDPELHLPATLGVRLDGGVDLEVLWRSGRFAEAGRMMVLPAWRKRPRIVLELMRAALQVAVERDVTHFVAAVLEDDPHSPYQFHMRQLGFERIGTHERGELFCASRRVLLVLDLARAYARLGARPRSVVAELARGLEERLATTPGREGSGWSGRDLSAEELEPAVVAS